MVESGMGEALDSRWAGGSTPREWQLLAQAYSTQARHANDAAARDRAFQSAADAYERWIASLARRPADDASLELSVSAARAHLEYGHLLLGQRANPLLDEHEISAGQSGDRTLLVRLLENAVDQYRRAAQKIAPLAEAASQSPEQFQVAGLDTEIQQISLDAQFNAAWSHYYLATLLPASSAELTRVHLNAAEQGFRALADGSATLAGAAQIQLGLAMVRRAQGQYPESERLFAKLLREPPDGNLRLLAQIQYELARCQMDAARFDDARRSLAALARRDPLRLTADEEPLRYYVNLAKLWSARSYLSEAEHLRKAGGPDFARKSGQAREAGIAQLQQLRTLGPSWPALVQLHIAANVDPDADASTLSPAELLAAANLLIDRGRPQDAKQRLQLAIARSDVSPDTRVEALTALGRCEIALNNKAGAAQAFLAVASRAPQHPQAGRAAEWSVQLLTDAAAAGSTPENARLAEALAQILRAQPTHAQSGQFQWMLAVALEKSGKFADAARAYGNLRADDPRSEEARFRQVACSRLLALAQRDALPPAEFKQRLRAAAELLESYATKSAQAPGSFGTRPAVLRWSAEALVQAAELYAIDAFAAPQETLRALQSFEQRYPGSALLGHVLGLRIRAHRALNQLQDASDLMTSFLRTVPPEQTAGVLSELAQGLLDEVMRLREAGEIDESRRMAANAVSTLEQLERALESRAAGAASEPRPQPAAQPIPPPSPSNASQPQNRPQQSDQRLQPGQRQQPDQRQQLELVRFSRARMLYFAGRYTDADRVLSDLRKSSEENESPTRPPNGAYLHLHAQLAFAQLFPQSPPPELTAARGAWAPLLGIASLQSETPDLYWEARYHVLLLTARLGQHVEVEKAIRNERAWSPTLGGPKWRPRFEELYESAANKR